MSRLQLIFCVETNKQSDTDFLYIRNMIDRFYDINGSHILLKPVYLGGKGRYSTKGNKREIDKLIRQFDGGANESKSYVLFCFDCDRYDSDPDDKRFLESAKDYCDKNPDYRFIWFCRDAEDVFLGHQVDDKQKKTEARRFAERKLIKNVEIKNLLSDRYRVHCSNICLVLDEFLDRKKSTR